LKETVSSAGLSLNREKSEEMIMYVLRIITIFVIAVASHELFGMELQKNNTVFIKTCHDNKDFELKKWKIKYSLILQVLHIHQQKENNNVITIPQTKLGHENVTQEDLKLFSKACKKKEDVKYFGGLSREKQLHHIRVAGVLNASAFLADYAAHFLDAGMGAKQINPYLVDDKITSYFVGKIIQQREEVVGKPIGECYPQVLSDGSYCLLPKIFQQHDEFSVSGKSSFVYEFSMGQETFYVKAYSPDGYSCIVTNSDSDDKVRIWSSYRGPQDIVGHLGKITHSVFANNGRCLITGSQGNGYNLLCTTISREGDLDLQWMDGHEHPIEGVIVSPDSNKVVTTARGEKIIALWDGNGLFLCNLGDFSVDCKKVVAFSSDSNRLVACAENKINLWDISCAPVCKLINTIEIEDKACHICMVKYYNKVNRIVVGRTDGKIHLFDGHSTNQGIVFDGHKCSPVSAIVGNEHGSIIVSATEDITDDLIVRDGITGRYLQKLVGHPGITFLQMSPDAMQLVSQSIVSGELWTLYPDKVKQELKKITHIIDVPQSHFIYRLYAAIVNNTTTSLSEQEKEASVQSLPTEPVNVKSFVSFCFGDVLLQKNQHERK